MSTTLSMALKEWDRLCTALMEGQQLFLLRKGGILEAAGEFELDEREFLLFPTFLHQDPKSLKAPWRQNLAAPSAEPDRITIAAWARVHRIFQVPDRARMDQLSALHIWEKPLIDLRFAYRPEKPLYLVVVETFCLTQPVSLENRLEYAGCKSWVPLSESVDISDSRPVVAPQHLANITAQIAGIFGVK